MQTKKRKLAAIMFTDIVGYTALMSKNEENALQILQKHRDILKPLISEFNGEWLKEMGDGTLSSFASVVDAVNCAIEIQNSLKNEPEFKLRIGIHIGDVVVDEGDVFGDGVNVASRIENLAEPGGICVSGRVYDDIHNKPYIEAEFIGEKELKNVSRPIKIYRLKTGAEPARITPVIKTEKAAQKRSKPSIAVLPFVDMSSEKDQDWFCDGISEEIINALTHVESLHVVARTSSFQFPGKGYDIKEIGKKLNVRTVLEGSVRKAGNRLRITAQLINIEDGYHLWSERFDREMEDVFAIQDEISLAIVEVMKVKLLKKEKAAIVKRHTENTEAYNIYLMGHYFLNSRQEDGINKAIVYFHRALEIDPEYALPYVGIADSYNLKGFWGFESPKDSIPKAKTAVLKAMEIDDTLGEAYNSLAFISLFYDWNWKATESEYKRAIELNPNYASTHEWYSLYLSVMGKYDEAITEAKTARKLDPLSLIINAVVGRVYMFARRFDEAIESLLLTLEINPNYQLTRLWLVESYVFKGMYNEAFSFLPKTLDEAGGATYALWTLGWAYAVSGQKDEALIILEKLKELSKEKYVSSIYMAYINIALGDHDSAFKLLDKAYDEREPFMSWLNAFGMFDPLRPDPRFKALLKKMGLPED